MESTTPSSPASDIYKTANATPSSDESNETGSEPISPDRPLRNGLTLPLQPEVYSTPIHENGNNILETKDDTVLRDDDNNLVEHRNTDETVLLNNINEKQNNKQNGHPPLCAASSYDGVKFIDPDGKIVEIQKDDSICSSVSSIGPQVRKPKIPDGGWGWVVVGSSLVISMIADGISFSFGLLYMEFIDAFGQSNSKTSWIGSLFMAVPLISGPVMSALVDRYGCKWMTIVGGIVSGTGFVIASFGNSVEFEYVTFGVIAGLGLGLCYVTAVVSVAYWFDKKRTLATSLGACGTGIGTFVYAPMTQFFISEFGWRGTVLLLAGTFLNMCVCGAVMRDPDWVLQEQSKQNSVTGTKSVRNASSVGSVSGVADVESQFPGTEEIRRLMKSGQSPEYILTTLVTSTSCEKPTPEETPSTQLPYRSVVNLPTFIRQSEKVPMEVLEQLSSNKRVFNVILENYPSLLYCRSISDQGKLHQLPPDSVVTNRVPVTMSVRLKAAKTPTTGTPTSPTETIPECEIPLLERAQVKYVSPIRSAEAKCLPVVPRDMPWMRHQFSFKEHKNHHYLRDIRLHRNSVMYRGAMLNIPRYKLKASSCPDIYRNSMTTIAKENQEKWYADILELCKSMFDFSMFLELHFLLMSFATILLFMWFIVPYFYLAEHLTKHGYTEIEASQLLGLIGITNTIGMVGLGWAGDQPWMHVQKTYSVCLVLCGISTILIPICTYNYFLLTVTCGSFGIFFASNYSFTPTILVELIPLDRFTTAYGLTLLCQGIGNLIGPPLAGAIYDSLQAWDVAFYAAGIFIIVAGFLIFLIPVTKNKRLYGSGLLEMDRVSNA